MSLSHTKHLVEAQKCATCWEPLLYDLPWNYLLTFTKPQ